MPDKPSEKPKTPDPKTSGTPAPEVSPAENPIVHEAEVVPKEPGRFGRAFKTMTSMFSKDPERLLRESEKKPGIAHRVDGLFDSKETPKDMTPKQRSTMLGMSAAAAIFVGPAIASVAMPLLGVASATSVLLVAGAAIVIAAAAVAAAATAGFHARNAAHPRAAHEDSPDAPAKAKELEPHVVGGVDLHAVGKSRRAARADLEASMKVPEPLWSDRVKEKKKPESFVAKEKERKAEKPDKNTERGDTGNVRW